MPELLETFPRPVKGSELQEVLRAERAGSPFIVYRDDEDELRIVPLGEEFPRRTIGRRGSNDVPLAWDAEVSRVHAEFERVGECWAVTDDGLSTNGTFVNGARITARRRLVDGDSVRVGTSVIVFRDPGPMGPDTSVDTRPGAMQLAPERLSAAQRRVLVALCRPFKDGPGFSAPATNKQIADELFLSVDAVKTHLRALFDKFGIADLAQNKKRLELVQRALLSGLITPSDL